MTQKEVIEGNLKKSRDRLEINYKKLPLLIKKINELKKEKDDVYNQILSDMYYIQFEEEGVWE